MLDPVDPKSMHSQDGEEPVATIKCDGREHPRARMFRRLEHCSVPGYAPACPDKNHQPTAKDGLIRRLFRDVPEAKECKAISHFA